MFMITLFSLFIIFIEPTIEVNLSNRVKLINGQHYYTRVLQETFYEIEERGFCNFKLVDFNQTLNESLYNWHVVGTVFYSNGFVVSIDRIALTNIQASTSHSQAGLTTATFSAMINMFGVKVGYDVKAVLDIEGTHKFTGIFTHSSILQTIVLTRNLDTGEMTATPTTSSVAGGSGVRMVYMPESTVSEVLSRRFAATSTFDNLRLWTNNIIIPILLEKASVIEFPDYCVHC